MSCKGLLNHQAAMLRKGSTKNAGMYQDEMGS